MNQNDEGKQDCFQGRLLFGAGARIEVPFTRKQRSMERDIEIRYWPKPVAISVNPDPRRQVYIPAQSALPC